jgi:hypothetical protein
LEQLHCIFFPFVVEIRPDINMSAQTPPFPVPNGTEPFWRTQLDHLDSHRTTEALPATADIVVIGAGYAGASTVYHLQEMSKTSPTKPSIVILEAREACSGATGRNGKNFVRLFFAESKLITVQADT